MQKGVRFCSAQLCVTSHGSRSGLLTAPCRPAPLSLCPALGLFLLCKMRRPIFTYHLHPPPPLNTDPSQPTFPRSFLPNLILGGRADVIGCVLALPSSLSALGHTKSRLFPSPHSLPSDLCHQPLQTTSFLPSSGLSSPSTLTLLWKRGASGSRKVEGGEELASLLGCSRISCRIGFPYTAYSCLVISVT